MKQLYLHTIGCQMNVYDSQKMAALLYPLGFVETDTPETADLILVNTCAIRAKAEQKLFSYLGRLAGLKRTGSKPLIGVGGCVAQQEGRRIVQRAPCVDFVFGTDALERLPRIIETVARKKQRVVDIKSDPPETPIANIMPRANAAVSRFVTIMQGCDNFCTYCVVPYVRGRERSRPLADIVTEVEAMVAGGVREVTLLGQNVNSYGRKEETARFPQLLSVLNAIQGLARIRFTTNHPKDLSPELIACFARCEKVCHHIHLPVQSGADRILKRMNRGYTRAEYVEKVRQLRAVCPDMAITSDIIVGFPGESEADFNDTLTLIDETGYDSLFAFMYSDRPNARAAGFGNNVDETTKQQRLQAVLSKQTRITAARYAALVGQTQHVLVEKVLPEKNGSGVQLSGRNNGNAIVHIHTPAAPALAALRGTVINVSIEKALAHSLLGVLPKEKTVLEGESDFDI